MKSIKVLFLATAACFFASACTVSAPEDNCKEASYDNIMCYEYSRDDCGNIICAPPSSSDSKKISSSSTVKSSSSEKVKRSSKQSRNPASTPLVIPWLHTCANSTSCRQTTSRKTRANHSTNQKQAKLLTSGISTRGQLSV